MTHCIQISGYNVYFPHQPYSIQKAYMARLLDCLKNSKNGLLESPTGTGKTLSILCSAMAWMDAENEKWLDAETAIQDKSCADDVALIDRETSQDRVHVIYASRTHVQLSQAMRELKKSNYEKAAIILGSRDQLCINKDVARQEGNATKTMSCRIKTRTGGCPYYQNYESKVEEVYGNSLAVVDIEDLVSKGLSKNFCPYFASRLLKPKADVIFSPYNYLLDPVLRRTQGIDLRNAVVIFDEGHNIEQNCEDCASSELRSSSLETCLREIDDQLRKSGTPVDNFRKGDAITSDAFKNPKDPPSSQESTEEMVDLSPIDLLQTKALLLKLQNAIAKQFEISKTSPQNRVPIDWFFKMIQSDLNLDIEAVDRLLAVIDKMSLSLGGSHAKNGQKVGSFDSLATFFRAIFPTDLGASQLKSFHNEFREKFAITLEEQSGTFRQYQENRNGFITVSEANKSKPWVMNLYCLSPSVAISQLMKLGVKCVVITSGTLSPLDSFESEMEVPFPVKLENKHVVEDKQVAVLAVDGRNDLKFDSRYTNRSNEAYPEALGEALIDYSRIIPDGLLVFFSSYAVMRKTTELWEKRNCIWDRLGALKLCFKEPQDKSTFTECLAKFKEQIDLDPSRGAVFFGVCRGKLSEGLDIGNQYCRAVVMIGIPYPSYYDNKSVLKREYVDRKKDPKFTSSAYYNIQMKRSLNQAIGRVIRHKDDYGTVLLLDFRFAEHEQSLSKWLRPYFKKVNYAESKKILVSFFETNQEKSDSAKNQTVVRPTFNKNNPPYRSPFPSTSSCESMVKSQPKEKPMKVFPIFDMQSAQATSSIGPEKKKSNARPSPYFVRKAVLSSPRSSFSQDSKSITPRDDPKEHREDIKTYLKEKGKMELFSHALREYQKSEDIDSLVPRITPLFKDVGVELQKNFLTCISSMLKAPHRSRFLTLCDLKP